MYEIKGNFNYRAQVVIKQTKTNENVKLHSMFVLPFGVVGLVEVDGLLEILG